MKKCQVASHVDAYAHLLDGDCLRRVPVHVVHKEQGQTSGRVRAVVDFLAGELRKTPTLQ